MDRRNTERVVRLIMLAFLVGCGFVIWRLTRKPPSREECRALYECPAPITSYAPMPSTASSSDGQAHMDRLWAFTWDPSPSFMSDDAPDCQPWPNVKPPDFSHGCLPYESNAEWICGPWRVRATDLRPRAGYAGLLGYFKYAGAAGDPCTLEWHGKAERKQ